MGFNSGFKGLILLGVRYKGQMPSSHFEQKHNVSVDVCGGGGSQFEAHQQRGLHAPSLKTNKS